MLFGGMELAKYRKRAGLTQIELGRQLGVFNRQTVGAWEANPDNMKLGTLKAYASACGVTIADLMGFDGNAQAQLDNWRRVAEENLKVNAYLDRMVAEGRWIDGKDD